MSQNPALGLPSSTAKPYAALSNPSADPTSSDGRAHPSRSNDAASSSTTTSRTEAGDGAMELSTGGVVEGDGMKGDSGEMVERRLSVWRRLGRFMGKDVDSKDCFVPLTLQCFMTGYIAATSFSACYIWCPFQTGNIAQLGLALARTFERNAPHEFLFPDKQAFTSLGSFILGTSFGRIGDRYGNNSRGWLVGATVGQGLMLMIACLMVWKSGQPDYAPSRGDPSWTNGYGFAALAFVSAALGLQGIIGVRLNTQFGTTLVLTTIWCTLFNDPFLFSLKHIPSRDHKVMAATALFIGAFVARAIMDASSTVVVLAIGVGIKVFGSGLWLLVKEKEKVVKVGLDEKKK